MLSLFCEGKAMDCKTLFKHSIFGMSVCLLTVFSGCSQSPDQVASAPAVERSQDADRTFGEMMESYESAVERFADDAIAPADPQNSFVPRNSDADDRETAKVSSSAFRSRSYNRPKNSQPADRQTTNLLPSGGAGAQRTTSSVPAALPIRFEQPTAPAAMAVMEPAVAEPARPPAQTTIEVFYATDRKSKFGISSGDWLKVFGAAMIALVIYLATFGAVFITEKKVFYGFVAFFSLGAFLYLGQSATVQWQKQKRLAVHHDASYLSEISSAALGDERLDYGTCKVTIPPDHRVGHIDSPSIFQLEFVEDANKHVILERVIKQDDKQLFFEGLRSTIEESTDRQALVFVHGYNVSFENAVKRTAQIAHDLRFDGAPICYSWSSHGALANYTKDMANADATVISLQGFLQDLVQTTDKTTIHLVAHSMGNRALLQALDRIAVGNPESNDVFGQLVMAAPDVSAVDFRHRFAPAAKQLASSVTLYASSRDRALLASTEIHGHDRAGLAGPNLIVMDGLDTIDVSEIDTSLIGHSYYGDHPELIKDMRALVELSAPAAQRQWLTRIIKPGSLDYFRFLQHEERSADGAGQLLDRR